MKLFHVIIITILSAIIVTGCSSYGKLIIKSKNEAEITIEELIKNSDDYDIHNFGRSKRIVSGIVFDPKKDNKKLLLSDMWEEINEQKSVSDIVRRINQTSRDISQRFTK